MNKQKIDKHIDNAAAQAKETIELFSEKLDQATVCATNTGQKMKNAARKGVLKAADKTEEAVTAAADYVREKVHK